MVPYKSNNSFQPAKQSSPLRTFSGTLINLNEEDSRFNPAQKQIKFSINPTSYPGKVRYEWYTLNGQKWNKLRERLEQLKLWTRNDGILRKEMINKDFEWEIIDNDPTWNPVVCRACGQHFNNVAGTRAHRQQTQHRIGDAGYILPVKLIENREENKIRKMPAPPRQLSQERKVAQSTQPAVQPVYEEKKSSFGTNDSLETVILSLVDENGISKDDLALRAMEIKASEKSEVMRTIWQLKKNGKLDEVDGKIILV